MRQKIRSRKRKSVHPFLQKLKLRGLTKEQLLWLKLAERFPDEKDRLQYVKDLYEALGTPKVLELEKQLEEGTIFLHQIELQDWIEARDKERKGVA